jgi:hypothetical protein
MQFDREGRERRPGAMLMAFSNVFGPISGFVMGHRRKGHYFGIAAARQRTGG